MNVACAFSFCFYWRVRTGQNDGAEVSPLFVCSGVCVAFCAGDTCPTFLDMHDLTTRGVNPICGPWPGSIMALPVHAMMQTDGKIQSPFSDASQQDSDGCSCVIVRVRCANATRIFTQTHPQTLLLERSKRKGTRKSKNRSRGKG